MPLVRSVLFRQSGLLKRWSGPRGARLLSSASPKDRLAVLCVLDGWGYNPREKHNAVVLGNTPNFDDLWGKSAQKRQQSFLFASEEWVGLPKGQIGNSEVGHMNLGAGRRILQDILAIDLAIKEKQLGKKKALLDHIEALKKSGGTCHLMGLVSPGGVHAMQSHCAALANEINKAGIPVVIHAFTDGRDVPPQDAINSMPEFLNSLDDGIKVGTVIGRYFAMDRDKRWERVGQAYDAMVLGKGVASDVDAPVKAIEQGYEKNLGDEFIEATVIGDYAGMKDGDGILMANFRADRARQILLALADPSPPEELGIGSDRPERPKFSNVAGMVQYSDRHKEYMDALFPVKNIEKPLGEVIASEGLTQLRLAETEKYPHVTFFFNGGRETEFENEDRHMCPSPKVPTYDLQPEMATQEICDKLCESIESGKYNLIVVNFAAPDMVGHTGSLEAAIKAVETCDEALGRIISSMKKAKGVLITTADHGNCEEMWEDGEDGGRPHTAHTLNIVPIFLSDFSGEKRQLRLRDGGALCDVTPTILQILGIEKPEEMTGVSLIEKNSLS